ncbi:DUF2851 family protein [Flagellimonas sp.]|uniref:DUF2851 family protein n=1 Tax=Flagellimonas sp. TaxID=2058762 RepID=UPI003AB19125
MREDLLHFIWRHNKLPKHGLCAGENGNVAIKSTGTQNPYAGPDFFNAQVEINGQLWAGNVEMHIKSSDWYAHHHETDENYDSVILHVVWEDDVAVFRRDGSQIPALELSCYVPEQLLMAYRELMENSKPGFINCEKDFGAIDPFLVESWLHRLYIERLEHKSELILDLLKRSNNDWEAVLFILLAKNFGSKVNGPFFLERAQQLDFSIVRKTSNEPFQLESLLFGHFGLLDERDCTDGYYLHLQKEYDYLSRKYDLPIRSGKPEFFGLRPHNFPTIRVSQLANLYHGRHGLFSELMTDLSLRDVYGIFDVCASSYWHDHFTFGKTSRRSTKKLSRKFIDLLVINTLVPLKFCYAKHLGKDWNEELIALVAEVEKESNSIIANFERLGAKAKNALESQAQLELYTNYCAKNKCLQCRLGTQLLNRNT